MLLNLKVEPLDNGDICSKKRNGGSDIIQPGAKKRKLSTPKRSSIYVDTNENALIINHQQVSNNSTISFTESDIEPKRQESPLHATVNIASISQKEWYHNNSLSNIKPDPNVSHIAAKVIEIVPDEYKLEISSLVPTSPVTVSPFPASPSPPPPVSKTTGAANSLAHSSMPAPMMGYPYPVFFPYMYAYNPWGINPAMMMPNMPQNSMTTQSMGSYHPAAPYAKPSQPAERKPENKLSPIHINDDSPPKEKQIDQTISGRNSSSPPCHQVELLPNGTIGFASADFRCPECEIAFYDVDSLGRHIRTVHKSRFSRKLDEAVHQRYPCNYCNAVLPTTRKREGHYQSVHAIRATNAAQDKKHAGRKGEGEITRPKEASWEEVLRMVYAHNTCIMCKEHKSFANRADILTHIRLVHNMTETPCSLCHTVALGAAALEKHLVDAHPNTSSNAEKCKIRKCHFEHSDEKARNMHFHNVHRVICHLCLQPLSSVGYRHHLVTSKVHTQKLQKVTANEKYVQNLAL